MHKAILLLMVSFLFVGVSHAAIEDFVDGMAQDDFAMLLVQELEIEDMLPTSAVITDYFDLLDQMGISPADGWDIDGVITAADLEHIVGDGSAGMDFASLVQEIVDRVSDALWARTGARPAVSPIY